MSVFYLVKLFTFHLSGDLIVLPNFVLYSSNLSDTFKVTGVLCKLLGDLLRSGVLYVLNK